MLGKANSNHEQPTWPARPSPFPPPWTFGVASVFGIGNWRFGIGNWRFGMRFGDGTSALPFPRALVILALPLAFSSALTLALGTGNCGLSEIALDTPASCVLKLALDTASVWPMPLNARALLRAHVPLWR